MVIKFIQIIFVTSFIMSCAKAPDYKSNINISDKFHSRSDKFKISKEIYDNWWEKLNSPALNIIIHQAIENNPDIDIAILNIKKAKSLRSKSISKLFPFITGSINKYKTESDNIFDVNTSTSFSTALDSIWEIDIFGKNRKLIKINNLTIDNLISDKRSIMISLVSEVAINYFEARSAKKNIKNIEKNIELLNDIKKINQLQLEFGVISKLHISKIEAHQNLISSYIEDFQSKLQKNIYNISVLTGENPEFYLKYLDKEDNLALILPDTIPLGLKSDILKRRPDIKKVEKEIEISVVNKNISIANLFPSFSLIGSFESHTKALNNLFTPNLKKFSIIGNTTIPLFTGGFNLESIKTNDITIQQKVIEYRKLVLNALLEVESHLVDYSNEWIKLQKLDEAKKKYQEANKILDIKYKLGSESLVNLLNSRLEVIEVEGQMINSETKLLVNLARLYKSLGGGWNQNTEDSKIK